MIIKFYEGDDIRVGESRGETIKRLVQEGAEWIDIDGALYRVSNIHTIMPSTGKVTMVGGTARKNALMPDVGKRYPDEPTQS